jgi:hypothetical protein
MKIKEMTPKGFLVQEMKYQLDEAKLDIPEADFKKGVDKIYQEGIEPRLVQLTNKKGFVNLRGSILIGLICKGVINEIKKSRG